jgi:lauroyl/myristoyl acyltransferase
MLKARQVRDILRDKGTDKGVVYVLETLAEQDAHMMKRLVELAQYFDKMVDTMTGVTDLAGRMKAEVQRIASEREDDFPPNTEDLGRKQ